MLADELRPIIMDNLSWHAKAVNHVMFDELDHVRCLYLPQEDSLHYNALIPPIRGRYGDVHTQGRNTFMYVR